MYLMRGYKAGYKAGGSFRGGGTPNENSNKLISHCKLIIKMHQVEKISGSAHGKIIIIHAYEINMTK